jgi:hypothetical protein
MGMARKAVNKTGRAHPYPLFVMAGQKRGFALDVPAIHVFLD